jgi:hypothetical protein
MYIYIFQAIICIFSSLLQYVGYFFRFYGGEYSDYGLVGRDIVYSCKWIPPFQRNMLPPCSGANGRWRHYVPPEHQYSPARLHGVTTQEI